MCGVHAVEASLKAAHICGSRGIQVDSEDYVSHTLQHNGAKVRKLEAYELAADRYVAVKGRDNRRLMPEYIGSFPVDLVVCGEDVAFATWEMRCVSVPILENHQLLVQRHLKRSMPEVVAINPLSDLQRQAEQW
jgi:hypothetical protein